MISRYGSSDLSRSAIQKDNFYVVYNFYVYPSWRREKIIPKYQRDNFAPARQYPRYVQFLGISKLAPKELIQRCQQDNFAPEGFEIQIGVWNSGREVDYTKTQGNEFPLCTAHFSSEPTKWKQDGNSDILKTLRPTPWATHCLTWKPTHLFVAFIPFTLGVNFLESRITREDREYFSFLKFKFEFEIWVWKLSLNFKLGSVIQPTRSLSFFLSFGPASKVPKLTHYGMV